MVSNLVNYVYLQFDTLTNARLFEYCRRNRLGLLDREDQSSVKIVDYKFHLTVMCSKNVSPKFENGVYDIYPFSFTSESLQMLGFNLDVLGIKLQHEKLYDNLFDYYRKTYGHSSDFVNNPHISIRGSDATYKERIGDIPLPDFTMFVDKLVHEVKHAK